MTQDQQIRVMLEILKQRQAHLVQLLEASEFTALAIVPGPNFLYLTGLSFHLMERPTLFIISQTGASIAIMPALEKLMWEAAMPDVTTYYWQDKDGFDKAFAMAAAQLSADKLGVEGLRMRVFEADALRCHYGQKAIANAASVFNQLRYCKDPHEIDLIEKAIAISELSLQETLAETKVGMSEKQIHNLLKMRMLANGTEGFAFEPIVLAGGNAANPHGHASDYCLQAGDPLLIDFGAYWQGYSADITRTFFCQHASDKHRAIYETVQQANHLGRELAAPIYTAHDIDKAVTQVLQDSAFADYIVHKTGHGLGLDVHEAPQIMIGNPMPLQAGVVMTIEPGLYKANDIGVRIEDDILITATGCRSLTSLSRELQIIG
ncbi:MAG: Xaa-Pro peptidase family protein [Gammaproteobacteria bacterium]|nr:Xaa-Pro peptidase family protein [Gammaproteobacteria bacterium]